MLRTQLVVTHFGWHTAYVALGALVLLVGIPASWFLLDMPATATDSVAAPKLEGLPVAAAVRTRAFWLTIFALTTSGAAIGGFRTHAVAYLAERGVAAQAAAYVLSFMALATTVGQIGAGALLDRFQTPRIGILYFSTALLGLVVIVNGGILPGLLSLGTVVLGLAPAPRAASAPIIPLAISVRAHLQRFRLTKQWPTVSASQAVLSSSADGSTAPAAMRRRSPAAKPPW